MKRVRYTGTSDTRTLSAADFRANDVEQDAVTFQGREPLEVSDEAAAWLTSLDEFEGVGGPLPSGDDEDE